MSDSHMPTLLVKDSNNHVVQLGVLSSPQNNIAVNGSAGAAVLTAAISKAIVRINAIADVYAMATVAGAVTAATGHYIFGGMPTDFPMPAGMTKISFLAVSTSATTVSISEVG